MLTNAAQCKMVWNLFTFTLAKTTTSQITNLSRAKRERTHHKQIDEIIISRERAKTEIEKEKGSRGVLVQQIVLIL